MQLTGPTSSLPSNSTLAQQGCQRKGLDRRRRPELLAPGCFDRPLRSQLHQVGPDWLASCSEAFGTSDTRKQSKRGARGQLHGRHSPAAQKTCRSQAGSCSCCIARKEAAIDWPDHLWMPPLDRRIWLSDVAIQFDAAWHGRCRCETVQ